MNIPAIGGTRGIFEIFIPGVFLLLNLGMAVFLFPFLDPETKQLLENGVNNSGLIIAVLACFGYLIGVILRLFQADALDRLSSGWMLRFQRKTNLAFNQYRLWAAENFPYVGWIGEVTTRYLPEEAQKFYKDTWAKRRLDGSNKQYYNYCKVLIASKDINAAAEIYAAESLTRYIVGMYYALTFSFVLIAAVIITRLIYLHTSTTGLLILLVAYLLAILAIVSRFRYVRTKEVEVVFAACFKNKELFIEPLKSPEDESADTPEMDIISE
jgi:hypothetical protein